MTDHNSKHFLFAIVNLTVSHVCLFTYTCVYEDAYLYIHIHMNIISCSAYIQIRPFTKTREDTHTHISICFKNNRPLHVKINILGHQSVQAPGQHNWNFHLTVCSAQITQSMAQLLSDSALRTNDASMEQLPPDFVSKRIIRFMGTTAQIWCSSLWEPPEKKRNFDCDAKFQFGGINKMTSRNKCSPTKKTNCKHETNTQNTKWWSETNTKCNETLRTVVTDSTQTKLSTEVQT